MLTKNHQTGVALITVLVIFSAITIMSIHMISSWSINSHRTANIINKSRSQQYMVGAEEFGKSLLEQYFEQSKAERVVRTQPWATTPMQFPIENNQGTLEGKVKDLHSCFNLNSILFEHKVGNPTGAGTEQPNELSNQSTEVDNRSARNFGEQLAGEKLFAKIIEPLLPETEVTSKALAATLRDWIDEDQEVSGADGAEDYTYTGLDIPYRTGNTLLAHSSELLVIKGYTAEIYDAIKDYICVLPTKEGTINVNTVDPAQAELVWALLDDADLATVRQALEDIPEEGYNRSDFFTALGSGKVSTEGAGRLAFDSKYMLMTAIANIKTGRAQTQSLMIKDNNTFRVVARHIGE